MISESLDKELESRLGRSLFELVPFNVSVIDREFRVLAANSNFEEYFGEWRGRRCFEVCKGSTCNIKPLIPITFTRCPLCKGVSQSAFQLSL